MARNKGPQRRFPYPLDLIKRGDPCQYAQRTGKGGMARRAISDVDHSMNKTYTLVLTCLLAATSSLSAMAQPTSEPTTTTAPSQVLNLWPGQPPLAKAATPADVPTLAVLLPDKSRANGCGVIVCPGGG